MSSSLTRKKINPLHITGVVAGGAAGAWLGTAEAPTKLVAIGIHPILASTAMVFGVFFARWTIPTLMKGTSYIIADLRKMPHLLIWGILSGAFEAVANTLSIFAIKDVGLAIAFPIWNSNSLIGLFWGWLLFNELKGASRRQWLKVAGGGVAIIVATTVLGFASIHTSSSPEDAFRGIISALGASFVWGASYILFRKAYISGMNPLSFLTVFTIGEVTTVLLLCYFFLGGVSGFVSAMVAAKSALFWLFLGGFCWVVGDILQQFAVKYIGIGRGIPLSNTNQLWGIAWAATVFYEFKDVSPWAIATIIGGSLLMICGASAIASAEASGDEKDSWEKAMDKECRRYNLDRDHVLASVNGKDPLGTGKNRYAWWDILIVLAAIGVFIFLATFANKPPMMLNYVWMGIISMLCLIIALVSGWLLHRHTGFA